MEIEAGQYLSRAEGVIFTELDGDTVILDMKSGNYNGLDDVATEIWGLLDHKTTFSQLVEHVVRLYEVDRELCTADIHSFLVEMVENGLLLLHSE